MEKQKIEGILLGAMKCCEKNHNLKIPDKGSIAKRCAGNIQAELIKEIGAWKETYEILSNPEIMEGLTQALKDFKEGKYTILKKL